MKSINETTPPFTGKNQYSKIGGIPIPIFLVILYCIVAFPFLIWHERHLPLIVILLLSLSSLLIGAILFFISVRIYGIILRDGFHPLWEGIVFVVFLLALSISGFLDNSAGRIFLILFGFLTFILRFAKVKLYYSLMILAMLLLSNGLLSFQALQKMEVFTAYKLFRSRFQFTEVDLDDWKIDNETRIITNRSIPIRFKVPEGLFFHNPEDLSWKDKTGSGQIAGILSHSETDPNSYPFIRIFFLPVYVSVREEEIREEVIKYIQFLEKQGEVEEVNEIQPNRDYTMRGRIPSNAFWTFYDILRPRYSKTGYYFFESATGSKVLFHVMENLEKGKYHEPVIQEVLDSLHLE